MILNRESFCSIADHSAKSTGKTNSLSLTLRDKRQLTRYIDSTLFSNLLCQFWVSFFRPDTSKFYFVLFLPGICFWTDWFLKQMTSCESAKNTNTQTLLWVNTMNRHKISRQVRDAFHSNPPLFFSRRALPIMYKIRNRIPAWSNSFVV